jgi:hypothetical protein
VPGHGASRKDMNGLYPIIRRVRRPLVRHASVTPAPMALPHEKATEEVKPQANGQPDKEHSTPAGQDARAPQGDDNGSLY